MLEILKRKVVLIAKQAEKDGMCKHKSGNFSLRDPQTGYVLITPSGVAREDLTYRDIIVVDIDGNIIELLTKVKPTSELSMHLTAYRTRSDVFGVVHTHSHYATSFAVAQREIKSVVFESAVYGGVVPLAPFGMPCTDDLANSIIEPLKKADACILSRHGMLAVGCDIDDAYLKACYVEDVALIYFNALILTGGKEPQVVSQKEFESLINV